MIVDILGFLAENFDLPILDWIAANLRCDVLDVLMPIITVLGDAGLFWIAASLVLLCIPKYRKAGLGIAISLLIGLVLCNITLKPLIARIRPYDYQFKYFNKTIELLVATPHDFSFPSGHTIASFEAAVALTIRHKKLGAAALVLAVLIAFSRMYLYVHYPTDVLASVILGTAIAFLGCFLAEKLYGILAKKFAK